MIAAPAEGVHLVIGGGAALRRAGQREEACAVIVVGREAAMLAPEVDGTVVGEGGLPSHPPADLLDDPPAGHYLAGARAKRALAAERTVAVGDGPVLPAPTPRGRPAPVARHGPRYFAHDPKATE